MSDNTIEGEYEDKGGYFDSRSDEYTSKTKRGECMNEDCKNPRRDGSAFCQECSDKYHKENDTCKDKS